MTLLRPVLALRRLVVLVLAAPLAACVAVENPGFNVDDARTTTVAETTGPDTATVAATVSPTDTGVAETGTTADDGTATGPSVTVTATASSEAVTSTTDATATDATATDATTTQDETTSDGTTAGPCGETLAQDIPPVADAFFIAGASDEQTCNYSIDPVAGAGSACWSLNFGATPSLRMARLDGGIDAMFAVKFSGATLLDLIIKGAQFDHAELVMTVYAKVDAKLIFDVGIIQDSWAAGFKNGLPGDGGDSSFEMPFIGVKPTMWTGGDGPRGASVQVAKLIVPAQFMDHDEVVSGPFSLDPWLGDPLNANGLVVSFPKDAVVPTFGPGFKAMESGQFQPVLRVHYCLP